MTDKHSTEHLNLNNLRSVTDKRNNFKVRVKSPRWIFPDYSHNQLFDSDYMKSIHFSEIVENIALCMDLKRYWLILGHNEKYVSDLLSYDFWELTINTDLYNEHFVIVNPTKLSMYMCWDDVLYVFEDGRLFVARSVKAIESFRKVRNI